MAVNDSLNCSCGRYKCNIDCDRYATDLAAKVFTTNTPINASIINPLYYDVDSRQWYPRYGDKDINVLCKTNADRIRAMTDEELAEWLCRKADCNEYCCAYRSYCNNNKNDEACKQAWLDWLKQEAK